MKITGTIYLDGVPHQLFIHPGTGQMTVPGIPAHQNGPPVRSAAPPGPIPKMVRLVAYEMKAGVSKTTAKPYRLHKFTSSDGESFATFKADIAATLQQAVNGGPVALFVTRDRQDRGWTVEFIALQQPGSAPAAVKPTPSEASDVPIASYSNDDPEYGEP